MAIRVGRMSRGLEEALKSALAKDCGEDHKARNDLGIYLLLRYAQIEESLTQLDSATDALITELNKERDDGG